VAIILRSPLLLPRTLATGETLRWQQVLHSGGFGRNPAGGIDDSHPITRLFAASQRFQFIAECLSAVTPSQVGTDGEELISQDGPILLKRVPNDDRIEDGEPATKEDRGGRRKQENQLGSDRPRFSRL